MSFDTPRTEGKVRKIAVFRALKLGDMLCAVPALRALRAAFREARIVLVGLPWACEFTSRFGNLLDGFRRFPGYPGLPEQPVEVTAVPGFLAAMQAEQFDIAVQLHGSGQVVNPLVRLFGARHTAGFYPAGEDCPDADWFVPWPARGTEVRRLLRLTEFLGVPTQGEHLEFRVSDADRRAAEAVSGVGDDDYACVHPGASVPERRWPAERFAEAADDLAARGLRVVLTGSAGEAGLTRAVASRMRAPAIDLAGKTDLGTAAALLARAKLLVCNDTGVSHLAAAVRCPSVVLSTGDNPARWAPADSARHRVLCRPDGVVPVADVLAESAALLSAV